MAIDFSFYKQKLKYPVFPSLTYYNITYDNSNNPIKKAFTYFYKIVNYKYLNIFAKLPILNKIMPIFICEQEFNDNIFINHNSLYLEGYFEDYKYFEDQWPVLKKEIVLKKSISSENIKYLRLIEESNSVSVHYRGGPYIDDILISKQYAKLTEQYFERAFVYIKQRVDKPVFFNFSNDNKRAKQQFNFKHNIIFIDSEGPDQEHLFLMSKCKHNIISNSTFSWWGAWLNDNSEKIVIAPKKWFSEEINKYGVNCPKNWVKLEN